MTNQRSEKAILNDTLVALSAEPDTIVWRNNTGQAWQGQRVERRIGSTIEVTPGMVILQNARPISFGLPGSGDGMGASAGIPLAVETKTATGRQAEIQRNFQRRWEQCGGLYILARSPEQAVRELRERKALDEMRALGITQP